MRPSALSWRMAASTVCTMAGARPREGSSNITSSGCPIRQRPMASICCSPPDSVPAACPARSARRGKRVRTRSSVAARPARARGSMEPMRRFSRTLSVGNTCRPSATCPMPRSHTAWLGRPAMSRSFQRIRPRVGACMPAMVRMSDVLPAPFAPTMATIAPAGTSRLTPSRACASPWKRSRPSTRSISPELQFRCRDDCSGFPGGRMLRRGRPVPTFPQHAPAPPCRDRKTRRLDRA